MFTLGDCNRKPSRMSRASILGGLSLRDQPWRWDMRWSNVGETLLFFIRIPSRKTVQKPTTNHQPSSGETHQTHEGSFWISIASGKTHLKQREQKQLNSPNTIFLQAPQRGVQKFFQETAGVERSFPCHGTSELPNRIGERLSTLNFWRFLTKCPNSLNVSDKKICVGTNMQLDEMVASEFNKSYLPGN